MKVNKYPPFIDPNEITEKVINIKNSKCPFCGKERNRLNNYYSVSYFGTSKKLKKYNYIDSWFAPCDLFGIIDNWFRKLFHLETIKFYKSLLFTCTSCKGEWESDPFPVFIEDDDYYSQFDFTDYRNQMEGIQIHMGFKKDLCPKCIHNKECQLESSNDREYIICGSFEEDKEPLKYITEKDTCDDCIYYSHCMEKDSIGDPLICKMKTVRDDETEESVNHK